MPQSTRTTISTKQPAVDPAGPPKVICGVATLPERRDFFVNKTLPSIMPQVDEIHIYVDTIHEGIANAMYSSPLKPLYSPKIKGISNAATYPYLGDAGKFIFFNPKYRHQNMETTNTYYLSIDDDLIYPPTFVEDMIRWIKAYGDKVAASLHGNHFTTFPIGSYYAEKTCYPCLGPVEQVQQTIFPGTCNFITPLSTFYPRWDIFMYPNMADIWIGLDLVRQGVPVIVVPHAQNYLTYNTALPVENTIWGKEHRKDFIQTAVVNQFSLNPGFSIPQLPDPDHLPGLLG